MHIILLAMIFASFVSCSILYFTHVEVSYKTMAIIMALVSSMCVAKYVFVSKIKIDRTYILKVFFSLVLVVILYGSTQFIHPYFDRTWYDAEFLALAGQSAPAILVSCLMAYDNKSFNKFVSVIPILSLIFTIVSFFATFNPAADSAQGLAGDDSANLGYQNVSQMAGFAASLSVFYLICFRDVAWFKMFNNKFVRNFIAFTLLLNLLTCLLSGGRGGLVNYIVQILLGLFIVHRYKGVKIISAPMIALVLAITVMAIFAIGYAETSTLKSSGFNRILRTINEGDSSGRDVLAEYAIGIIKESPLWGYGLGGVFVKLFCYSHNIFLDILLDGGVILLSIILIFIYNTLKKLSYLISIDIRNSIWLAIFFDGFMMNCFSGYYLVSFPMLCALAFSFSKYRIITHV